MNLQLTTLRYTVQRYICMYVCERTISHLKVSALNQVVLLQSCLLKGGMPLIGNQHNISIIRVSPFVFEERD